MDFADDAKLMRRWQNGDPAAFAALVERWQRPVARFLARLAGQDCAADLSQETFLRLLRSADRYRERGSFSTWLFQIALNVARDAKRRRPRDEPLNRPPAFAETGDESCERDELAQCVAAAVAELPANQREVLALRHDGEMSFEAMARLLNTPASTLKSRFTAALTRIRARLAELGFHAEETRP
jgi:RNA polymerase sigma-70 factor (ECF subfamily)